MRAPGLPRARSQPPVQPRRRDPHKYGPTMRSILFLGLSLVSLVIWVLTIDLLAAALMGVSR
ncbi:MAG: hypothetical protein QNI84_08045 [Henriciella sp.]|nr:hypothetical protein [Henriciella sp.]